MSALRFVRLCSICAAVQAGGVTQRGLRRWSRVLVIDGKTQGLHQRLQKMHETSCVSPAKGRWALRPEVRAARACSVSTRQAVVAFTGTAGAVRSAQKSNTPSH